MVEFKVEVKGLDELIKKLPEKALEIVNEADQEFEQNVEIYTVPTAKALAPVKTGELRDSIDVERVGPLALRIGTPVPYGSYQEEGFVHPQTGQFIRNPFLNPAIEGTKPIVESNIEKVINKKTKEI